jgi:hypothetical protein
VKFRFAACFVAGSLVLAVSQPSAAQSDMMISGNQTTATRDCAGGNATVSGNENKLTLQNCNMVSILGNDNTIRAESARQISVPGNHNIVTWTRLDDGKAPGISNLGTNNRIREARPPGATSDAADSRTRGGSPARGPAPSGAPFAVTQDGRRLTHDCRGGPALVAGNRNTLTLRNCTSMTVAGNSNIVDATMVQNLTVQGNDNTVTWHPAPDGSEPTVSDVGNRNKVVRR